MAKLRGALIGCGFFAVNHLHAWRHVHGAEIVALCDRDEARLKLIGDQFGIVRRHADARRMLEAGEIDFVDIATTAPSHRSLVELAARFRLPAICQKPFATTIADAKAMVAAAEEASVLLMVHENFRWQAPIIAVKAVLESGDIGAPFWGRVSFRSAYDVFSGQPYLATGKRFIVEDLGIHCLDIGRFLFGDAERVSATVQRINPAIAGEDVATALISHAGGITSVMDCSYASRLQHELFPQTLIEVDGSRGTLRLGADYQLTMTCPNGTTRRNVAPPVHGWAERPWHGIQDSVLAIQQHWTDCLRMGREPATSGRDNLQTLALVEGVYQSAASGQSAIIAELLA